MNRIRIVLSSVQNEFAVERKWIADYIRQDALFFEFLYGGEMKKEVQKEVQKEVMSKFLLIRK